MTALLSGFFGLILVLAFLQVAVPMVVQLADAILLAIFRAPFRFLAHRWRIWSQLNPYQRGLRRATEGAFLLAACVYAATWFPLFLGQSLGDLAQGLVNAPTDHPGIAAFFTIVGIGLLWIVVGIRGARGGDRDWMSFFWSATIAGGAAALLWWHWFPWPDRTFATLLEIASLKTLYTAAAAAGLVRLCLTLPPLTGGNALRRVLHHIQQRARQLRPARPRSF